MIILARATSSTTKTPGLSTAAVIGIVSGIIILGLFMALAQGMSRAAAREQRESGSVVEMQPTSNRNTTRTPRQRRRDTDPEPLPAYESRATNTLVSPNDVSYDAPAAFDLAEQIALAERTNVAPSMQAAITSGGPRSLMERMKQVQRSINELNRLTAATPAGGYAPHSLEALKIVQLKQNIALMSETERTSAPREEGSASRAAPLPVVAGPPEEPVPIPNTPYARMLEVQRLLAEVDNVMSQPASLETSIRVQTLRARIAEVMEADMASESSSSSAPAFPEPVHLTSNGRPASGSSPRELGAAEPGRSAGGEREVPTGEGGTAVTGPREPPPPYNAVVTGSMDDDDRTGARSVK